MFKKYYQFKKIKGLTEVFFIFRYADLFSNKRLYLPTNNFIPLNPILIDHTNNSFVFHANHIEKIKSFDFILSLEMNESNQLERLLPIPFEYIKKSIKKEEKQKIDQIHKENYDCKLEVFQICYKHE